jgi:hypothetical protein
VAVAECGFTEAPAVDVGCVAEYKPVPTRSSTREPATIPPARGREFGRSAQLRREVIRVYAAVIPATRAMKTRNVPMPADAADSPKMRLRPPPTQVLVGIFRGTFDAVVGAAETAVGGAVCVVHAVPSHHRISAVFSGFGYQPAGGSGRSVLM